MSVNFIQSGVEKITNKNKLYMTVSSDISRTFEPENPCFMLNVNAKEFVPKSNALATSSQIKKINVTPLGKEEVIKKINAVHAKIVPHGKSISKADKVFNNKIRAMGKKLTTLKINLSKADKNFVRRMKVRDRDVKAMIKSKSELEVKAIDKKIAKTIKKQSEYSRKLERAPKLFDMMEPIGPSVWDYEPVMKKIEVVVVDKEGVVDLNKSESIETFLIDDDNVKTTVSDIDLVNSFEVLDDEPDNILPVLKVSTVDGTVIHCGDRPIKYDLFIIMDIDDYERNNFKLDDYQVLKTYELEEEEVDRNNHVMSYQLDFRTASGFVMLLAYDWLNPPSIYNSHIVPMTRNLGAVNVSVSELFGTGLPTARINVSESTFLEDFLSKEGISAAELGISSSVIMSAIPAENFSPAVCLALLYQVVRAHYGSDPVLLGLREYEVYISQVYSKMELIKTGLKEIYLYLCRSINAVEERVDDDAIVVVNSVSESPLYQEMLRIFGEIFFLLHAGLSGTRLEQAIDTLKKITLLPRTGTLVLDLMSFLSDLSIGCKAAWSSGKWQDMFLVSGGTQLYFDTKNLISCVYSDISMGSTENMPQHLLDLDGKLSEVERFVKAVGIDDRNVPLMLKLLEEIKTAKKEMYGLAKIVKPRAPPFAVQITGEPCTAKSSVVYDLVAVFQRADGRTPDPKYIMQPNIAEKYDSTLKEYHADYVLDDLGQVKADSVNEHMQHRIIAWNNIMASFANRAELDGKGAYVHVPRSIFVTSNDINMEADKLFTYPSAFLRRFPIHVKVFVRKEFKTMHKDTSLPSLDASKLKDKDVLYALQFQIYHRYPETRSKCVEVLFSPPDGSNITYDLLEMDENNNVQKYMTITNLERAIYYLAGKHLQNGYKIVSSINSYFKNVDMCHCGAFHCDCDRNKLDINFVKHKAIMLMILKQLINRVNRNNIDDEIVATVVVIQDYNAIGYLKFWIAFVYMWFWYLLFYPYYHVRNRVDVWKLEMRENLNYHVAQLVDDCTTIAIDRFTQRTYNSLSYSSILKSERAKKVLMSIFSVGAVYGLYKIGKVLFGNPVNKVAKVKIKNLSDDIEITDFPDAPYKYPGFEKKRNLYEKIQNPLIPPVKNTTPEKLERVLESNQYGIKISNGAHVNKGVGIFIKDKYFVTCLHNFKDIDFKNPNYYITIQLFNKYYTSNYHQIKVGEMVVDEEDRVMFYVATEKPHSDISKFISTIKLEYDMPIGVSQAYSLLCMGDEPAEFNNVRSSISNLCVVKSPPTNYYSFFLCGAKMLSSISEHLVIEGMSGSIVYSLDPPMLIGLCSASRASNRNEMIITPLRNYTVSELRIANDTFPEDSVREVRDMLPTSSRNSIAKHVIPGTSRFLGSLPGFIGDTPKTCFRASVAAEFLLSNVKNTNRWVNRDKEIDLSIPILKHRNGMIEDDVVYFDPYLTGLAEMSRAHLEPHHDLIDVCYDDFISILPNLPKVKCGPLTWDEVVNGAEGFNKLNDKAGAGIKFASKVSEFLDVTYVNNSAIRKFKPEFLKKVILFERDIYEENESMPIFKCNLKDEVISTEKVLKAGERTFNGSELDLLAVMKKYIMPILVYMQVYPFEFECMAGVNALGQTWDRLGEYLQRHPYVFSGDVSKFDKTQLRILLIYFRFLLYQVSDKLEYSDYAKRMVWNLSYHFVYWIVSVKGDVFEVAHSNPSGVLVTLQLNSFVMSMLMRIAWYMRFTERFRENNNLVTLGDDHVNNTKESNFTFKYVKQSLSSFQIKYTTADKKGFDYDFQNFADVTFLKRYFKKGRVRDKEYYLAPIEEKSIIKMLSFTDRESNIENMVLATLFVDAMKQYWFYGRERFNIERAKLQSLAFKCGFMTCPVGGTGMFHIAENPPSRSPIRWMTFDEITEMYLDATLQVNFA